MLSQLPNPSKLLRVVFAAMSICSILFAQQNIAAQTPQSRASLAQSETLATFFVKTDAIDATKGLSQQQKEILDDLKSIASGKEVQAYIDLTPSSAIDTRYYLPTPPEEKQREIEAKLLKIGQKLTDAPSGYWLLKRTAAKPTEVKFAARADLEAALSLVEGSDIRFAISLPDYARRALIENYSAIDEAWGGGTTNQWVSAFRSVAIGASFKESKLKLVLEIQDPDSAKVVTSRLPTVLKQISTVVEKRIGPAAATLVQKAATAQPKLSKSQVDIEFTLGSADSSLLDVVLQTLTGTASSQVKMHRFRQIALAIHNFESAFKYLPPNRIHRNDGGKARLSWRVSVLPFINTECEELYNQFHHDEPWDSPHNLTLLPRMPEIFSNRSGYYEAVQALTGSKVGRTTFLAPVGKDTTFGGTEVKDFKHIVDGLSNTIWLVEVEESKAVPWTAPEDFRFDPKSPFDGMAIDRQGNFLALMGDGSVSTLNSKLGAEVMVNLFQINDGKAIKLE